MAKTIYLNSISDSIIATLDAYISNMVHVEEIRNEARAEIKKLTEKKDAIIASMNEAIENGESFDNAKEKFSTVEIDRQIASINNDLKETLKPFNEAKREMLKGLCMEDLYNAYVVGVKKTDFSAYGSVTIDRKKANGETVSKTFSTQKSFNGILKEWLLELGLKNADNDGAVGRYARNYLVPFIGTKIDKLNADLTAYSKTVFADTLLVAFKKSLEKAGVITTSKVIDSETGYSEVQIVRAKVAKAA